MAEQALDNQTVKKGMHWLKCQFRILFAFLNVSTLRAVYSQVNDRNVTPLQEIYTSALNLHHKKSPGLLFVSILADTVYKLMLAMLSGT